MPPKPASARKAAADPSPAPSDDAVAAVARALAHPARVHIVRLLLERQSCICGDIVEEVGLAQSTVSEHLRILKEAGVVAGEIARPRVCYCLDPASLAPLAGFLDYAAGKAAHGASCEPACPPSRPPARRARKVRP